MPKEYTYANTRPYGDDFPGRSVAEVSWSREAEHVQLGTLCIHEATGERWIPDWVTGLIPPEKAGSVPSHVFAQDGWFIDLDRQGINKLIRDLRRARDQAFGRDE